MNPHPTVLKSVEVHCTDGCVNCTMWHDCKHMFNCTCATLRESGLGFGLAGVRNCILTAERGASTARFARAARLARLRHRCRNGIVLDLVQ